MITTRTVNLDRFKNAVGLVVTFSARWGNTRKANIGQVTLKAALAGEKPSGSNPFQVNDTLQAGARTEAEAKERLQLKKQLIRSKEYEAIKSFQGEIRTWIYARTVPSFFKEGFQLASLEAITTIEDRLKKAQGELAALVNAFLTAYPGQIEEARKILEPVGQFNPNDYPPAEYLKTAFDISWNWIAFSVPETLPAELRAKEEDKLKRQFEDAGEQITTALRVAFGELIAHATERLTDSPDGKKKTFRDSVIGNITDFIETFNSRNLMNDAQLAALVGQAKQILESVTPQKLRDYGNQRENIRKQFAEIKSKLDPLIIDRKSRKFELDEPEADAAAA